MKKKKQNTSLQNQISNVCTNSVVRAGCNVIWTLLATWAGLLTSRVFVSGVIVVWLPALFRKRLKR